MTPRQTIIAQIAAIEANPPPCLPVPECTCPVCNQYCDLFGQLDDLPPSRQRRAPQGPNVAVLRSKHERGVPWSAKERLAVLTALEKKS